MNNEIIFNWVYPDYVELPRYDNPYRKGKYVNVQTRTISGYHPFPIPDYENDESAWTQELYGKIEEAGLWRTFILNLDNNVPALEPLKRRIWLSVRSTHAQKSEALARAIEELAK